MDTNRMETSSPLAGTIGEAVDRLEVGVGRIGFNSPEQALAVLRTLDDVHDRLDALENEQSRKLNVSQLEGIEAKLRNEASPFLRDLGGVERLRAVRSEVSPAAERWWWYLDDYLARRSRSSLRSTLIALGIVAAVFAVLAVLYQTFFAPDPAEVARYTSEQNARDLMGRGDFAAALVEVDKGLQVVPGDPSLLIVKGVVHESLGQADEAGAAFAEARSRLKDEVFFLSRSQMYLAANKIEQGLADARETLRINPGSGEAYLLVGQAYETTGRTREALEAYDQAFAAADAAGQHELAVLARTRSAMLMQMISGQPFLQPTATP